MVVSTGMEKGSGEDRGEYGQICNTVMISSFVRVLGAEANEKCFNIPE
jgi:hypothetical protein